MANLLAAGAKTNVKTEVKTIRVEDGRGAEGSFPCHLCLAGAFLARFFCFFLFQEIHLMLYTHRLWKGETASQWILCHHHLGGNTSQTLFSFALLFCTVEGRRDRVQAPVHLREGGGVPEQSALVRRPRGGGLPTSRAVKWAGAGARQICAPRTSPPLIALNDPKFQGESLNAIRTP